MGLSEAYEWCGSATLHTALSWPRTLASVTFFEKSSDLLKLLAGFEASAMHKAGVIVKSMWINHGMMHDSAGILRGDE